MTICHSPHFLRVHTFPVDRVGLIVPMSEPFGYGLVIPHLDKSASTGDLLKKFIR